MLKKNISLVMILFIPIFLHSEPVSLNQARAVAQNFINSRSLENYTIKTIDIYNKNNQDVFYYINFNPTGFIVISADNRIKPILAYSYDNSFLLDNSSPGIQWISDYYYEIGNLFADYSYLKDDLYISYEYGDNKIDWSILTI